MLPRKLCTQMRRLRRYHMPGNLAPCDVSAWLTPCPPAAAQVPSEILVERVVGRRMDPETGAIYHLKYKPPPAEIVSRLVQRSDDTEEKVSDELAVECHVECWCPAGWVGAACSR